MAEFKELKDQIIKNITIADDESSVVIQCTTGKKYTMFHSQNCCESVSLEDVIGNLEDIIGEPILLAEERTSNNNPEGITKEEQDSFTWTFYELATIKGSVTLRWYGESNGYYSESVDFMEKRHEPK